MNLMRWRGQTKPKLFYSPFRQMEEMMNRMFSDFFGQEETESGDGDGQQMVRATPPSINMYQEGDNLIIEAQVPGYNKGEITVELENDVLTISGEHKESKEEKGEGKDYYYREYRMGSFTRSISLPGPINPQDLKAKFQDGMLKITMPASQEAKKGQQINIE